MMCTEQYEKWPDEEIEGKHVRVFTDAKTIVEGRLERSGDGFAIMSVGLPQPLEVLNPVGYQRNRLADGIVGMTLLWDERHDRRVDVDDNGSRNDSVIVNGKRYGISDEFSTPGRIALDDGRCVGYDMVSYRLRKVGRTPMPQVAGEYRDSYGNLWKCNKRNGGYRWNPVRPIPMEDTDGVDRPRKGLDEKEARKFAPMTLLKSIDGGARYRHWHESGRYGYGEGVFVDPDSRLWNGTGSKWRFSLGFDGLEGVHVRCVTVENAVVEGNLSRIDSDRLGVPLVEGSSSLPVLFKDHDDGERIATMENLDSVVFGWDRRYWKTKPVDWVRIGDRIVVNSRPYTVRNVVFANEPNDIYIYCDDAFVVNPGMVSYTLTSGVPIDDSYYKDKNGKYWLRKDGKWYRVSDPQLCEGHMDSADMVYLQPLKPVHFEEGRG